MAYSHILPAQELAGRSAHPVHFNSDVSADLQSALHSRIEGEVRFDPGSRALYAHRPFDLPAAAHWRRHSPVRR